MKKNSNAIITLPLLFVVYITGIGIALLISEKIVVLPFNNPWGVLGLLTQIRYNPTNDIVKFITIITLPSIFLIISFFFVAKKQKGIIYTKKNTNAINGGLILKINSMSRNNKLFFLSIIFVVIMALNIPTNFASSEYVDSFHEGESLGASISYLAANIPYKEYLFAHGIFQDPLRSVIAFKLFGKSIGSARTFESILKIFSFVLLFILLLKLFRQNYLYAHITFTILILVSGSSLFCFPQLLLILPRDITTFVFIVLFLVLNKIVTSDMHFSIIKYSLVIFFFSFVSLSSFLYSIDRGFYIFATFILFFPVIYFFSIKKNITKYYILSSVLGIALGIILLGFFLKWNYATFFKFVFCEMPKYKELMDGKKYPFYDIKFLFPVAIMAFNMFWIINNLLNGLFGKNSISSYLLRYLKTHLIEICLFVMSIFFFRSALGRSDWPHVIYSSVLSYILLIYIIINNYLNIILQEKKYLNGILIVLITGFILLSSIAGIYEIYNNKLFEKNFPYNKNDSDFIPNSYKNTILFIKENLEENDGFFTMTSEAIWYYYINRPSPSRFSVVWFAMPYFYQEQVVNDLKSNNIKIILYKNMHWANNIDGFTNQERLPIIYNYIKKNYSIFKVIDDNELWIKKNAKKRNHSLNISLMGR